MRRTLEPDPQSQLQNARIISAGDLPKRDVIGIGGRILELRVIEQIKGLRTEFGRDPLSIDWCGLCQSECEVCSAWPAQ